MTTPSIYRSYQSPCNDPIEKEGGVSNSSSKTTVVVQFLFETALENVSDDARSTLMALKPLMKGLAPWNIRDVVHKYQEYSDVQASLLKMSVLIDSLSNTDLFRYKVIQNVELIKRLDTNDRYKAFMCRECERLIKAFGEIDPEDDAHFVRLLPKCKNKLDDILPWLKICRSNEEKTMYVDQCLKGDYELPVVRCLKHYSEFETYSKLSLRRNQPILPQILSCISTLLKKQYQISFENEKGCDGGGVSKEMLTLAATEIRTYFAPILATTDGGLLTLEPCDGKCVHHYETLGSLLFWMLAQDVTLPKRMNFSSELYHDLARFKQAELMKKNFHVIFDQCGDLQKTRVILFRFFPKLASYSDSELQGFWDVKDDLELQSSMLSMIKLKQPIFHLARGISCEGRIALSPLLQYALFPDFPVWPLLQNKELFLWEDVYGDKKMLQDYFSQLMHDLTEREAKKFVQAVTAALMLPYGVKITIKTQGVDKIALPRVSTCECSYFCPQIPLDGTLYSTIQHKEPVSFRDYGVFRDWFLGTLDYLLQGFGLE